MDKMPKWADIILIPLISVLLALIVSGFVVLIIGENPIEAMQIMVRGAFGSAYGWGYTLYYATNFIFTGLAVAVAFHARLFNIGGEGQAALGGLGVALVLLSFGWPHWTIALLAAILGAALFGAGWAAIPAYLQAKRGSHIVITTIMFNFIASALLVYLLVNVFRVEGSMAPESARFVESVHLPSAADFAGFLGFRGSTPLNFAFFVALLCCVLVWFLIWRTRLGYEIRAFGHSETAAVYAGINPTKIIMITMLISGGPVGNDGDQRGDGRGRASGPRLHRRGGFRRHRRGADGPVASRGRGSRRAPLRGALPRGRRASVRNARRQPRDDRGHPGPRDPLHRGARQHGAHADGEGLPLDPPQP
jgi:ABC-type uncharacterized transport system permease subunit